VRQGELNLAAPSQTLYRARYLLPIAAAPIADGALLVEGNAIRACGAYRDLAAAHPRAAVVDFGAACLLPPLVNAHTHLELTHFPAWADAAGEGAKPDDFVAWILHLVRVKRSLTLAQLQASLAAGLQAALRAGTGAIGDILTTLDAATAYRSSPLYGRIFTEVLGRDPAAVSARLKAIEALLSEHPDQELTWGLSPHAPYTLSAVAISQVFAFAARHKLQSAMHLAESAEESRFLASGSGAIAERLYVAAHWDPAADPPPGRTPVQALCQPGRLRSGDLVVHGVQVDDADIALLKQTGCSVVLCPRSNAALKVGKAPLAAYLTAGVPLALGTDSLASAPSLSLWEELAFARQWFADQAAPRDWLHMATSGGARALGLAGRMGELTAGSEASFQVVTLPQMPTLPELEAALCSAGQDVQVTHLYLAAKNVLLQC